MKKVVLIAVALFAGISQTSGLNMYHNPPLPCIAETLSSIVQRLTAGIRQQQALFSKNIVQKNMAGWRK